MDIKVAGITQEIMQVALDRAHAARLHILGEMNKAMDAPRGEVGKNAPRIEQIKIPTDKIRDVDRTGGKVIREIVEKTGAKVNVEDTHGEGGFGQRQVNRSGDQVDQVADLRTGSRPDL
ncbi:MAG: KH domain-containing protein [Hyphomonadaceae bacterium]